MVISLLWIFSVTWWIYSSWTVIKRKLGRPWYNLCCCCCCCLS